MSIHWCLFASVSLFVVGASTWRQRYPILPLLFQSNDLKESLQTHLSDPTSNHQIIVTFTYENLYEAISGDSESSSKLRKYRNYMRCGNIVLHIRTLSQPIDNHNCQMNPFGNNWVIIVIGSHAWSQRVILSNWWWFGIDRWAGLNSTIKCPWLENCHTATHTN